MGAHPRNDPAGCAFMEPAGPDETIALLRERMRSRGRLLVAFSGGLDSAVLAAVAAMELGDNAMAVIVDSETLPGSEMDCARRVAFEIGIRLDVETQSALELPELRENVPDRCYFCRRDMVRLLGHAAVRHGMDTIADGVMASDLEEHRPGIKASTEAGVWHPLAEAGLDKAQVRELARHLGLSISEKPSQACLSSRIPYGQPIDQRKLRQVEEGEELIRKLGFTQVRLRHHGDAARVELLCEEVPKLLEGDRRERVVSGLRGLGFRYVTVDLEGYRPGSMDEALTDEEKARAGPEERADDDDGEGDGGGDGAEGDGGDGGGGDGGNGRCGEGGGGE